MPKLETFDKAQVIDKAMYLFHAKGYHLTSMQDLVDATGLNRSSIYNSFGSKLDLYRLCLKNYQQKSRTIITKLESDDKSYLQVLKRIFLMNVYDQKGCFINNCTSEMANHEVEIRSFLENNHSGMLYLFEDIVTKGQQSGEINTHISAKEYAFYLLNAFQGLRITGILKDEQSYIDSIIHTTLSILQ